ncbi:MAG TPA: hypothetical protein VF595_06575 [Tepidisphaeraceae bacterium]|jgi:hypothetical protein
MKLVSKLALAVALAAPSLGWAQQTATVADTTVVADPNVGALTFSGGVDLASAYYFRGYLQENAGFIVQPYFGVATSLVETDDFKIGLSVSTWNSIHSRHGSDAEAGAAESGPDAWYESDIYVSAPISFGKFTVTPSYYLYLYPNGAFESIQEALLTVAYDDTDMWESVLPFWADLALKPYATIAYELQDGNSSEDGYFEVGIAPTYTANVGEYKIPLTIPIALGMSFDDYFTDDEGDNNWWGYLSAGVQTSVPIPDSIIPAKYGSWAVTGGAYYMNLFADSLELTNNESPHVFWGKVGLTFSY